MEVKVGFHMIAQYNNEMLEPQVLTYEKEENVAGKRTITRGICRAFEGICKKHRTAFILIFCIIR